MNQRHEGGRRSAVWGIIRSKRTDKEKLARFEELANPKPVRVAGSGLWRAMGRPSALQAGKLRRVRGEEA